ncbi:MAG: phage tail tube protein [Halobacteria archaeon]
MSAAAGHDVRLSYLWEDDGSGNPDFATGSPSDSDNKPFGSDASLKTHEGANNAIEVFDPNSREAREVIERNFEGSWSVEWILTNPWILRAAIDNNVSSSGTDPTTHTYSGEVPYSMRLVVGNEQTGHERILKGCVLSSISFSADVGGMVKVSADGAYADEKLNQNVTLTSQPSINERPMTFAQAQVDRAGSTLSLIQNAQVQIQNNIDLLNELGTRTPVDYSPKQRTATISYGDIVEDDAELTRMYGDSAATAPEPKVDNSKKIEFIFDNGKSGASKNLLNLTLKNCIPDSYSRSGQGDPEADLEGELSEVAAGLEATAENSTGTAR